MTDFRTSDLGFALEAVAINVSDLLMDSPDLTPFYRDEVRDLADEAYALSVAGRHLAAKAVLVYLRTRLRDKDIMRKSTADRINEAIRQGLRA